MAVKLGRVVLPKLPGDADLNGTVDFTDLLTLAQHYGKIGAGWRDGDFNANRSVGFDDLLTLAQNYGRTGPAAAVVLRQKIRMRADQRQIVGTCPPAFVRKLDTPDRHGTIFRPLLSSKEAQ